MFSILINNAIQECVHIEKQAAQLSSKVIELEQAMKAVRSLSGMEGIVTRLERLHQEMESEQMELHQMMWAFNKTILNYLSCENRICDNGEQNAALYARQEIGVNDFSDITKILSGM